MRRALLLLAVALPAVAEPILILRGDSIGDASPNLRDEVAAYASRVGNALAAVGAEYLIISDRELSAARLAGAPLVVLPYNRLTDTHVQSLRAYIEAGGQIAACFTTGSPRLPDLLGVGRGELLAVANRQIRFTAAAREAAPHLPEALDQDSEHAFELIPLAGARTIATWGLGGRPAIVQNEAGVYVGHVLQPGDLTDKGIFLLGLAAARQPELWQPALLAARDRAVDAARSVMDGWDRIARHVDLDPALAVDLGREVTRLTGALAVLPPPPTDAGAPALLPVYRALQREAEALMPKLAVCPEQELRGIWVFGSRPIDWAVFAAKCREAGLNAVFYRVSRGGSAVYPSGVLPQEDWSRGRDELAEAITECHRYGLELHAWRVNFHLGSAPASYREQLRREGRLSTRYNGETANFANPGDPRNRAVERRAIRELVERYQVDGVHLDYIRYTEVPDYDFDYGPVSRREFERTIGRRVADWPREVERGELKWAYEDWLRENINAVVRTASQDLRRIAPTVCFSAAVWRGEWKYKYAIRQDWPLWLREGWLDLIVPMNYVTTADEQEFYAARQMAQTGGSTRLALGLGAWLLDNPADIVAQVEVARRTGSDGFVLFSSNAGQIDAQLEALAQAATARPARPASQVPTARWRLPTAVARRYLPPALQANIAAPLEVTIGPGSGTVPGLIDSVGGSVVAVRPETGEELARLGEFLADGAGRAVFTGELTPPEGRFQLLVRGNAVPRHGGARPFIVRGPVVDGLTADEAAALARELAPPAAVAGRPLVGVWFDTVTGEAIFDRLKQTDHLAATMVRELSAEHLKPLDVLIVAQLNDVGDWRPGPLAALREWVAAGGRVMLIHDAVGYRWHPTPFPELGYGSGLSRNRRLVSNLALGAVPAGGPIEHLYQDHVQLRLTAAATPLLIEPNGTPVVARGKVGQGTVILNGMLTGATGGTGIMPSDEFEWLLALLELTPAAPGLPAAPPG